MIKRTNKRVLMTIGEDTEHKITYYIVNHKDSLELKFICYQDHYYKTRRFQHLNMFYGKSFIKGMSDILEREEFLNRIETI